MPERKLYMLYVNKWFTSGGFMVVLWQFPCFDVLLGLLFFKFSHDAPHTTPFIDCCPAHCLCTDARPKQNHANRIFLSRIRRFRPGHDVCAFGQPV
jgi:hypothetical protein